MAGEIPDCVRTHVGGQVGGRACAISESKGGESKRRVGTFACLAALVVVGVRNVADLDRVLTDESCILVALGALDGEAQPPLAVHRLGCG